MNSLCAVFERQAKLIGDMSVRRGLTVDMSVTSIDSLLVIVAYIVMSVTRIDSGNVFQVHSLFSLLSLHHAYVTNMGRLVGIISLKEVGLCQ